MQELKRMREQVEQLQSEREQLLKAANNKGKLSGGSKEKFIGLFEWNIRRGSSHMEDERWGDGVEYHFQEIS